MDNKSSESIRYPGTLVLPGDSFDTSSLKIIGRRVAGKEFSKGVVNNLNHGEELNIIVYSKKEKEYLESILNPCLKNNTSINIHTDFNKLNLDDIENLHIPGPDIDKWSAIRSGYSSNKFSITGIIHTLCSNEVINSFKNYVFGGLEPWDALVCTSTSGQQVVERTINHYHEYFEKKYNIKITKEKRPQLYKIPLAANDITFNNKLTRKQKRLHSRKKLGISDNAIVILFLGRLSSHGKAHPLPLYNAISKLIKLKEKTEIVLLECGKFNNETIEKLYNNLIKSITPLTVMRVGGTSKATQEEKIDSLNSANIFISLSDNIQETFGLTVIEAMAAELPCIVSDWNGYRDLVKEGETGYLIPTKYSGEADHKIDYIDQNYFVGKINYDYMIGLKAMKTIIDENILINRLVYLLDNEEIREEMGRKSRERWKNQFTWKKINYQYREMWANLKDKREGEISSNASMQSQLSMDYMFKDYATKNCHEDRLIVEDDCTPAEMLIFPLHLILTDIITNNNSEKIIEHLNKNKFISLKCLNEIGLKSERHKDIMALIEKLGIAKKQSP